MKKIKEGYKIFQEKYMVILNKYIMYFLILSMSLFLATDYFPIIEKFLFVIAIYILVYIVYKNFKPLIKFIKSPFFIWYMTFWIVLIIITYIENQAELINLVKMWIVFSTYIFEFGILYCDDETREYLKLTRMMEITAVFLSIWILVHEFPMLIKGERIGISIMTGNQNSAGILLSIYSFFIIYNLTQVKGNKKQAIKHIISLILCGIVIFATGSKKAIIIAGIASILFIYREKRIVMKRVIIFSIIGVVAIVACCTVPALYKNVGRRFMSMLGELGIIEFQTDNSSKLRMTYAEDAIELWKNKPIFGGGYNNFRLNSGYNTYSHNNYTELLCSVGVIGTLIYYGYYIILLKKNIWLKSKKNMLTIMYSLFIISLLFSDIGAVTFSTYPLYYMMLFLIEFNVKQIGKEQIGEGKQEI